MHWYDKDGNPQYDQPNKSKGGTRPTTLRDARKLGLGPSVTTICSLIDKPGLRDWAGRIWCESYAFLREIMEQPGFESVKDEATKRMDEASSFGTECHDILEEYMANGEVAYGPRFDKVIPPVTQWLDEHVTQSFAVEKSFYGKGYGGKIDLIALLEGPDVEMGWYIIDYKTTKPPLKSYDEHLWQLAAYHKPFTGQFDNLRAANLLISSNPDDPKIKFVDKTDDLVAGYATFQSIFNTWVAIKGYTPPGFGE